MRTLRSRLPAAFGYLVLLGVWWLVAALNDKPGTLWPSPLEVLDTIWDQRSALWINAKATLAEAALGFLLGVGLAASIALVANRFRILGEGLQQVALALYSLPLIALAPVLVLWVGPGMATKVIVAAFGSFFPVLINFGYALRTTDRGALELMRASGASGWQTFMRVELPYALPALFASFTIAGPAAIVGAMVAEWVGGNEGLGVMILFSMTSYDVPTIWASLVTASVLSLLVYLVFAVTGRALFPWHPSVRRVEARV